MCGHAVWSEGDWPSPPTQSSSSLFWMSKIKLSEACQHPYSLLWVTSLGSPSTIPIGRQGHRLIGMRVSC